MNEENGKHEFNFFLDKQIQLQLLEADEEICVKEKTWNPNTSTLKSKNSTAVFPSGNNVNSNKCSGSNLSAQKLVKDLHNIHICGWVPEGKVTYRKAESDGPSKSKGNAAVSNRESLMSRDSRNRTHDFVFRHYTDPRRYIEQYRREHVCYDTANSAATKTEFLDSRRFYAYNQYSPYAISLQNGTFQQSTTFPSAQQEVYAPNGDQSYQLQPQKQQGQGQSVQYSNRREQTKQTISASLRSNSNLHKYKLSKTTKLKSDNAQTSEEVSEHSEIPDGKDQKKRGGSAREQSSSGTNNSNAISIQKAQATKVNVPYSSNSSGTPTRGFKSTQPGSLAEAIGSQKIGHGNSRTLESLACVAQNGAGKQRTSTADNNNNEVKGKMNTKGTSNQPANYPKTTASSTTKTATPSTPKSNLRRNVDKNLNSDKTNHKQSIVDHINRNSIQLSEKIDIIDDLSDSNESSDSADSIGRLSTTCLGVEETVKEWPKLEPSCTYHVFPNEFMLNTNSSHVNTLLWNPAKSALEKRSPGESLFDSCLVPPFRNSPRPRPSTEEGQRQVEFITKDWSPDGKMASWTPEIGFLRESTRHSINSPGLKTNAIKPDLPPTFQLQGISKRPQFEALKAKRGPSKTAGSRRKKDVMARKESLSRKSWSASTDTSSSNGNMAKLKPSRAAEFLKNQNSDGGGSAKNSNAPSPSLGPLPYFKFWNSSLPPKSRDGRRAKREKQNGHDIGLKRLAEMVLGDENGRKDHDLAEAAKKVLEQQQKLIEDQQATAGIASGVGGKNVEGEVDVAWTDGCDAPSSGLQETIQWTLPYQTRLAPNRTTSNKSACKSRALPHHLTHITECSRDGAKEDCSEFGDKVASLPLDQLPDTNNLNITGDEQMGQNQSPRKEIEVSTVKELAQDLSGKEKSLLSMSEDFDKLAARVSKRWAVARTHDHKSTIPHKRRIQHLIEQSKLRSPFGQPVKSGQEIEHGSYQENYRVEMSVVLDKLDGDRGNRVQNLSRCGRNCFGCLCTGICLCGPDHCLQCDEVHDAKVEFSVRGHARHKNSKVKDEIEWKLKKEKRVKADSCGGNDAEGVDSDLLYSKSVLNSEPSLPDNHISSSSHVAELDGSRTSGLLHEGITGKKLGPVSSKKLPHWKNEQKVSAVGQDDINRLACQLSTMAGIKYISVSGLGRWQTMNL